MEVPADIDEDVERAFDDLINTQGTPQRGSLRRVSPTDEFRDARSQFNQLQPGYAERLGVGAGGQVHHAIELQVLARYPGVFTAGELNALENMRGVPPELTAAEAARQLEALGDETSSQARQAFLDRTRTAQEVRRGRRALHNSQIRLLWNRHYRRLDAEIQRRGLVRGTQAYNNYVRRYLIAARDEIDFTLGQFFSEYRRQVFVP